VLLLACGAIIGAVLMQWRYSIAAQGPAQPAAGATATVDLKALDADVTRLKALVPSNSHIMMDVQWHWTNLWFAGQAKNWPLAQFYFNETRSHIQWLIKKSPKIRSQGPDKEEVDIQGIFDGVDTSTLADVKNAIAAKDSAKFTAAYTTMLDSCYSCHKSVGRPYLKPMIPKIQVQSALTMDPNAT
jgi:cytochrome c553